MSTTKLLGNEVELKLTMGVHAIYTSNTGHQVKTAFETFRSIHDEGKEPTYEDLIDISYLVYACYYSSNRRNGEQSVDFDMFINSLTSDEIISAFLDIILSEYARIESKKDSTPSDTSTSMELKEPKTL